MKNLHIFKAGKHTDVHGTTVAFSESDLSASAAAYDPKIHEAPIVIGHPTLEAPAYGWIKSVATTADGLSAVPHQLNTDFADMVASGAFKKISASFYTPNAANNPVPGVYYLRHVGFLGAAAPAIKGLKPVEFAAGDDGVVEFGELAFGDYSDGIIARLFRGLRDWMIDKDGLDAADKVLPDWTLNQLTEEALREDDPNSLAYKEQPNNGEVTVTNEEKQQLEAENARLKADIAARDAQAAAAAREARTAENLAYAEKLVAAGKLIPAKAPVVAAVLDALNADKPIEFGEGSSKQPLADMFKQMLDGMPEQVMFGEVAGKQDAANAPAAVDFAAPTGATVSSEGLVQLGKIQAYQAEHNVDFATAAKAVEKQS